MAITWAILGLLGDYLRTDWGLFWESKISRAACKKKNNALNFELTLFHPGGADLPPPRTDAYTRKKSMGGSSDNFCILPNVS